ncbi:ABC transporter ATP-binding protein [Pedobacter psychroterrae]|uniref:ABC transporter ATP-binding protein n=1 Tax=Pedobacter psychroterrae TaxID=2530453 RepID=A0A4R0NPJ9_9SPHI|nr:ABC transporter ATP-binding protein [Pedobacter psychroterrae]TCD02871.1 ABC transporter ATP-binding protein [Pedobacter psychroterrae]
MIKLTEIEKIYRTTTIETTALNKININIDKGEFVAIMGPSGCGKSTLLNIIGLLDTPTGGTINIDNQAVTSLSRKKLAVFRNLKLGFIFQSYHLINDLSVIDNVELPLLYRSGISGAERRKRALEALGKVGLSARTKHYPNQLSGGQRQRVAIARAIIGNPEILLADEPTGNLDSAMGEEVMNLMLNLNKTDGTTIVMVTHDAQMAKKTQRIIHFFDGQQVS